MLRSWKLKPHVNFSAMTVKCQTKWHLYNMHEILATPAKKKKTIFTFVFQPTFNQFRDYYVHIGQCHELPCVA